jgi:hypothetical protein
MFKTVVTEFTGYNVEFVSTIPCDFGLNNTLDHSLDMLRRLGMYVNLDGRKTHVTLDGGRR